MKGCHTAFGRTLIGALGAVGLLAGTAASAETAARPLTTHTVTTEVTRFQPDSLAIKAGDRVVWINRDPFPHTVVSSIGKFRSPEIGPGQSWSKSVKQAGVVPYACSLHQTMKAELRVD